jgi:hypothetical protein
VKEAAVKVAKSVAKTEMSPEKFIESFCDWCKALQKAGKISMSRVRSRKK